MADPILEIQNLNSWYGKGRDRRQVLKDVSLTLAPGEALGVVGESGSGKTTLAKCVLGIVTDYQGTLKVNSQRPQMVFQDPYGSLNPARTVGWFLEEALQASGVKRREERRDRAITMLCQVGLDEEHYGRRPAQLSGGQRQRVSIAAALIQEIGRAVSSLCWTSRCPPWMSRSRPRSSSCWPTCGRNSSCPICSSPMIWRWFTSCATGWR